MNENVNAIFCNSVHQFCCVSFFRHNSISNKIENGIFLTVRCLEILIYQLIFIQTVCLRMLSVDIDSINLILFHFHCKVPKNDLIFSYLVEFKQKIKNFIFLLYR